jgi:hypothetical protein
MCHRPRRRCREVEQPLESTYMIDQLRVWNRPLSDADVAVLV